MGKNILFLGASDKGGVAIYVSNLIKEIKSFSFYIPVKKSILSQTIKELYPNAYIFEFDYDYTLLTLYAKARDLNAIIKEYKIDIIHAHVLRFGLLGAFYKKYFNNNIGLVYTGHGLRYTQKEKKYEQWLFKKIEKLVNSVSDYVIFIRNLDYQNSLSNKILNIEKAVLIKTQIRLFKQVKNEFSLKKKYKIKTEKIIAMIGTVYDIKNPYLFYEIAQEILKIRNDITFLWIGDGPMLAEMREFVISLEMQNKIQFVGSIAYDNMKAVWDEIEILLLTSKIESFPLVVLEAYQSKTLVLSTDFYGVNEVIRNGFTGYVFNINNKNDAIEKLENILLFHETIETIKENALCFYNDNFSDVIKMAYEHAKIYKEL